MYNCPAHELEYLGAVVGTAEVEVKRHTAKKRAKAKAAKAKAKGKPEVQEAVTMEDQLEAACVLDIGFFEGGFLSANALSQAWSSRRNTSLVRLVPWTCQKAQTLLNLKYCCSLLVWLMPHWEAKISVVF